MSPVAGEDVRLKKCGFCSALHCTQGSAKLVIAGPLIAATDSD